MSEAKGAKARVEYDGDHKLLAFLGAAAFVVGGLFWLLAAVRYWDQAAGLAVGALGLACSLAFVLAWALRVKMEDGAPLTGWEVRRLMLAGLILGVVVGALPYFLLRFKLADPDFLHLASEPANMPPAWR